ncbi:hypothetical protein GA0115246_101581, partial [Streptomyces sp. SolWspMP-sol7th]
MLTLHTAPLLDAGDGTLVPGGAVAVSGDRITAVGPLADLRATYPGARVREWPGRLAPARVHTGPPPQAPEPPGDGARPLRGRRDGAPGGRPAR